jgi:hypothetical protein
MEEGFHGLTKSSGTLWRPSKVVKTINTIKHPAQKQGLDLDLQ